MSVKACPSRHMWVDGEFRDGILLSLYFKFDRDYIDESLPTQEELLKGSIILDRRGSVLVGMEVLGAVSVGSLPMIEDATEREWIMDVLRWLPQEWRLP